MLTNPKKALITGICGFAGSHLAELLLKDNLLVSGIDYSPDKTVNIEKIKNKIKIFQSDLSSTEELVVILNKVKPDYIFHLAAQTFVPDSLSNPANTFEVNIIGTLNLLEAVRKTKIDPIIHIACTSEEYGLVDPKELPVNEENPLRPLNPYAVSKIGADFLGYQYFKSYGLKIIRTRAFNHTGPRRGENFAESSFAKQIIEIKKGIKEGIISVGNLDSIRDFTDVRDVVKAYYQLVKKEVWGEV